MKQTLSKPESFLLWIDGVGCYRIIRTRTLTIGGPTSQQKTDPHHLSLLAELDKKHLSLERNDYGYLLSPHGRTRVDQAEVKKNHKLSQNNEIQLGEKVFLSWRIPHVLSQTAVIDFTSHHRPKQRVDGVVWMEQFCMLGAGRAAHICCPELKTNYFIYYQKSEFMVKSELSQGQKLDQGGIYTADDLQFRYEVQI